MILYELLTGTLPYVGEGLGELFAAILEQDAPGIRERNPNLDPGLELVVMKCLKKKKEDRWESVAELAAALSPYGPGEKTGTLAFRMTQGLIQPAPVVPAPSHPSMTAAIPGMRAPMPSVASQTGSAAASWATGSGPQPAPKKPIGLIAGIAAGGVLLIGGIAAVALKGSGVAPTPSVSVSVTAPVTADSKAVEPPVLAKTADPKEDPPRVESSATSSAKVVVAVGGGRPGTRPPVVGPASAKTAATVVNVPPVSTGKKPNAGSLTGRD